MIGSNWPEPLHAHSGRLGLQVTPLSALTSNAMANNVNPISGGTYEDLVWAKAIDENGNETSNPTARNPNFGHATARYAPLSAQIGFRLTF